MFKKLLPLILISFLISSCADKPEKDAFIEDLISKMTLEEKIGQLSIFTSDWDVTGPTMRQNYLDDIKSGGVGAIFNAYTVDYTRKLQKIAVEESRLGIPLLFGYDVIHGHQTIFPISLGESASWDINSIEEAARIAAIEASANGLHWTFAPMVDIARDPRWGRISEGAGEDVYLGTQIAKARVRGFQGKDLSLPNTILATAKHYAAYGAAQGGRDYNTVDISDRTLWETYLPPFKAAVDENVATFMTSFNEIAGVPSSGSNYLLKDILKGKWAFEGFVVTDYTSINEMVPHGFSKDLKEAGEQAINAGVDMDMQGAVYKGYLKTSVEEGKVGIEVIDNAVRRILTMKKKLGLFDDPFRYCDNAREDTLIMSERHLAKAREFAANSVVLLKNEDHILPLKSSVNQKIALIGPLANSKFDLIGSWSAAGDWSKAITVLEGMQKQLSGKIMYAKGANINDEDKSGFDEAIRIARQADIVFLAVGESKNMSGEAASRSEIGLPGVQPELVEAIAKTGKPLVLIVMNGRPLTIGKEVDLSDAVLETWFLGTTAGDAITDVITGKVNPSAKLPVTFPRNVGQVPLYYDMKNTGRPFDAMNKYTSKYLDVSNDPLFPFGYGLSYTSFEYSDFELSSEEISFDDTLNVSVTLTNSGDYDGAEVVQLYIRDLVGSVTRPVKQLKGFKKVFLNKGESKKITFALTSSDLAFYDINMDFKAEKGLFKIFIGGNSQDVLEKEFLLK